MIKWEKSNRMEERNKGFSRGKPFGLQRYSTDKELEAHREGILIIKSRDKVNNIRIEVI